jgi:hypothetical protein
MKQAGKSNQPLFIQRAPTAHFHPTVLGEGGDGGAQENMELLLQHTPAGCMLASAPKVHAPS